MKILFATESYGTIASSVQDVFRQTAVQRRMYWITSLSSLYNVKGVICYIMVDILAIKKELSLELRNYYFLHHIHIWSSLIFVTHAYSYSLINIT